MAKLTVLETTVSWYAHRPEFKSIEFDGFNGIEFDAVRNQAGLNAIAIHQMTLLTADLGMRRLE